jgi:pimeloyl-ACP methyl ester carboxylesterase
MRACANPGAAGASLSQSYKKSARLASTLPRFFEGNTMQPRFPRRLSMVLALAVSAVAGPLVAHADASAAAEAAAELANRTAHPTLSFKPCAENPGLDCATLKVPVDYRQPWGEKIGLAVIRARATQPTRRIGVLFANPGGPGGSGFEFVAQGVNAPGFIRLRERFDIVSFDVRGSHRSHAVRCDFPPAVDPGTVPATQLPALFDNFSRELAANCLRQNGNFITTLTTNNIARDLDMLRRALQERQITYAGLSHGTVLGAVYASLFPHNVRAMLLDAGMTPDFTDSRLEFRAAQALSFETVFQRLDQLCKEDTVCKLRSVGVVATVEELTARLNAAPVTSASGAVLNGAALRITLDRLLSLENLWPTLVDGLADARAGNYTLMFQLLAFVGGNTPAPFTAFNAILCNEFNTRRPAAEYLPFAQAAAAVASHVEGRFSVAGSVANCAMWPEGDPPIIRSVRGRVATPILIIGTQFDPNTPIAWSLALAGALGMERHVLRYQGVGHTAYARLGNTCVDRAGDAYLFDLVVPAPGATCAARPIVFRPAAAAAAVLRAPTAPGSADRYWPEAP